MPAIPEPGDSTLPALFSILYVEDDLSITVLYERMLQHLGFQRILSAADGEAGLHLFEQARPDIVLSDIMMPKMDGLDMVQRIKHISPETPIIMATAFSEKNFLMRSIEIGVDRYIVKPIDRKQFDSTLLGVCRTLYQQREAEEYAKRKIQMRINKATANTLSEVANIFPNPTIIYGSNGEIHFINDAFTMMFENTDLEMLSSRKTTLDQLFLKRPGFLNSLESFHPEDTLANRVLVRKNHINTIYQVNRRTIVLGENQEHCQVFSFTNVTRLEYEKHKSQNLARLLREAIKVRMPAQKTTATETTPASSATPLLSNAELAVLRRSHLHKTPASEYINGLDEIVIGQVEELAEVDFELEEHLIELARTPNREYRELIAADMEKYARAMRQLVDFNDLAFALEQLGELIRSIAPEAININKFIVLMDSVRKDLADWRQMIFITREALDIHYLDSSLFSSCLQIQLDFAPGDSDGNDGTGDLELF